MIDFLDPASARFLNALERISQGSERAHRQVSSGIRVSRPSDAPDAVSQVLQIQAALARVNQARKNLGSAKAEADTGESSLAMAGRLLEKIAVLGAEGANGLDDAAKRSML
ncbi:MAG: hypothetical protein HY822_14430, partial [Acidobacteria bacterium]|nr:hypothetical protein [Acidobacteriota bacterium]